MTTTNRLDAESCARGDFAVGRRPAYDGENYDLRYYLEEYSRLLRGRIESDRQLAARVGGILEQLRKLGGGSSVDYTKIPGPEPDVIRECLSQ